MDDPFAVALGALFNAPGSAAADYIGLDNATTRLRIIRATPDVPIDGGLGRYVASSYLALIQRCDVPEPASGAMLAIRSADASGFPQEAVFEVAGTPELDTEGLTWTCELVPARDAPPSD